MIDFLLTTLTQLLDYIKQTNPLGDMKNRWNGVKGLDGDIETK